MTDVVQGPAPRGRRSGILVVLAFVVGVVLLAVVGAMLVNIFERKQEATETFVQVVDVEDGEMDASVWGQNFPLEYSRFLMMEDDTVRTAYGGSQQYDKLARFPAMQRLWNGYAFAVDFREDRSHWYTLVDQKETKRQEVVQQPGRCANCHSRRGAGAHQEHGLGGVQQGPVQRDHRPAPHRRHVQRLPRPGHDGAADHASRLHGRDGGARHRPGEGEPPGDAHVRLRPVPRRVLLRRREQDPHLPLGEGTQHRQHQRLLRRVRLQGLGAQGHGGSDAEGPASRVRALQHEHPRPVGRLLRRLPHAVHP